MRNEAVFQAQPHVSALRKLAGGPGVPDEIVYAEGALWARGYRFPEAQIMHYVDRIDGRGPALDTWSVTGAKGSFKVKLEKERSDVFEQLPRRLQQAKEVRNVWPQAAHHPVWGPDVAARWASTSDPPTGPDLPAWREWADAQQKRSLQQLEGIMASYDRMVAQREKLAGKVGAFPVPSVPKFLGDRPWSSAWQAYDAKRKEWSEWADEIKGAAELQTEIEVAAERWAQLLGIDANGFLPTLRSPAAALDRTQFIVYTTNLRVAKRLPDLLAAVAQAVDAVQPLRRRAGSPDMLEPLRTLAGNDPAAQVAKALEIAKGVPARAKAWERLVDAEEALAGELASLPTMVMLPPILANRPYLGFGQPGHTLPSPEAISTQADSLASWKKLATRTREAAEAPSVAVEYQGARFAGQPPLDLTGANDPLSLSARWAKELETWKANLERWAERTAQQQKRWDAVVDRLADAKTPLGLPGEGCWLPPQLATLADGEMTEDRLAAAENAAAQWSELNKLWREVVASHATARDRIASAQYPHDAVAPIGTPPATAQAAGARLEALLSWSIQLAEAAGLAGEAWAKVALPANQYEGIAIPSPPPFDTSENELPAKEMVEWWMGKVKAWLDQARETESLAKSWTRAKTEFAALHSEIADAPTALAAASFPNPVWESLKAEVARVQTLVSAARAWKRASTTWAEHRAAMTLLARAGMTGPEAAAPDSAIADPTVAVEAWTRSAETLAAQVGWLQSLIEDADLSAIEGSVLPAPGCKLAFTTRGIKLTPDRESWVKAAKQWAKDERAWESLDQALSATNVVADAEAVRDLRAGLLARRQGGAPKPKWSKDVAAWTATAATVGRLRRALEKLARPETTYPTWSPGGEATSEPYRAQVRAWVAQNAPALAADTAAARVHSMLAGREGKRSEWRVAAVPWLPLRAPFEQVARDLAAAKAWSSLGVFTGALRRAVEAELRLRDEVVVASEAILEQRMAVSRLAQRLEGSHAWRQALEEAEPAPGSTPRDYLAGTARMAELAAHATKISAELDLTTELGAALHACARILEASVSFANWEQDAWNAARDRDLTRLTAVRKRLTASRTALISEATKQLEATTRSAHRYRQTVQAIEGTGLPDAVVSRLLENAERAIEALQGPGGVPAYVDVRLKGEAQVQRLWTILEMEHGQFNRKVASTLMEGHAARRIDTARNLLEHALATRSLAEAGPARLELQRALSQAVFPKDIDRTILVGIGRQILNQERRSVSLEV